ncbi:hypothetical protein PHISP_00534 [Aspergillus sp. HF37]|nr:hypothetical protein PHISP_00534 [Aspergillus sp. HF37]
MTSSYITVVPASTRAGKEAIRALLEDGNKPFVRGIYRNTTKVPAEYASDPNFEAVEGDVGVGESLDFGNSDAVFFVPPPTFEGMDTGEWATLIASNVREAIKKAPSVKKLVLHSAVGAHHEHGIGILRLNRIADRILRAAAPEVVIVQPGWYIEMFARAFQTMQADPPIFETEFSPADHKTGMVSVQDIGRYCANALLEEASANPGPREVKLLGPRLYSSLDVQHAVEEITGQKAETKVVDKQDLPQWFEAHVPKGYAQELAELVISSLPGGILEEDVVYTDQTVRGTVEMVDALRRVATQ